ncbi:metallophosphoesterase family protein [Peptoanaerobacter stomatis]
MSTYVVSDIHGKYDKFIEVLDKINLKEEDTLYVLGDILDRGKHPIKVMLKLMEMKNVICIVGNHELMAIRCMDFIIQKITETSTDKLDKYKNFSIWYKNGAKTTIDEFIKLDSKMKFKIIDYMKNFITYKKLYINGKNFLLVHGGLGDFHPDKKIEEYTLDELVWNRVDYDMKYFDDIYLVTGHTPTMLIESNTKPGYIYKANNHIAIDCGACFNGGRLGAICLDTGEEFYSS